MCQLKTLQNILNYIYALVPVLFILCTMAVVIIEAAFFFPSTVPDLSEQQAILTWVTANLKGTPINGLAIANSTGTCPTGYSLISLYSFPGTQTGCSCSSGSLFSGACSSTSTSCQTVAGLPAQQFYYWQANTFCVSYLTNFVTLSDAYSQVCPTNYIRCSSTVCARADVPCPITDVQIISTSASVPAGYTSLSLAQQNMQLVYGRTQLKPFLLSLTVSNNNISCLNPNNLPANPSRATNILFPVKENGCGTYGTDSTNTITIQQDFLTNFYITQNSATLQYSSVPGFASYLTTENAYLEQRLQIYTKPLPQCQNLDFTQVRSVSDITSRIGTYTLVMLIILLSFYLVAVLMMLFYFYRACRSGEVTVAHYPLAMNIIMWIILGLLIAMGAYNFKSKQDYDSSQNTYNNVLNNGCFSDPNIIRVITDTTNAMPYYVVVVVYLSFALMIAGAAAGGSFLILYIVMYWVFRYRKDNVDYDDRTNRYYDKAVMSSEGNRSPRNLNSSRQPAPVRPY